MLKMMKKKINKGELIDGTAWLARLRQDGQGQFIFLEPLYDSFGLMICHADNFFL